MKSSLTMFQHVIVSFSFSKLKENCESHTYIKKLEAYSSKSNMFLILYISIIFLFFSKIPKEIVNFGQNFSVMSTQGKRK